MEKSLFKQLRARKRGRMGKREIGIYAVSEICKVLFIGP
jgi:hypothetical protein